MVKKKICTIYVPTWIAQAGAALRPTAGQGPDGPAARRRARAGQGKSAQLADWPMLLQASVGSRPAQCGVLDPAGCSQAAQGVGAQQVSILTCFFVPFYFSLMHLIYALIY